MLSFMQAFDRAMNHLDKAFGFVDSSHQYISRKVRCTRFEKCARAVSAGPPVQWPSKGCCVTQAHGTHHVLASCMPCHGLASLPP